MTAAPAGPRSCAVCGASLPVQRRGRPRRYCGPRCHGAANRWAATEQVIAELRRFGDRQEADDRQAWLDQQRRDARDGWAGARARLENLNAEISRDAKTPPPREDQLP